jgi:hypothetical protein
MDEIAGLSSARDRAKRKIADLKEQATGGADRVRHAIESDLQDLEVSIDRVRDQYFAWDATREKRFHARLDEAAAKLALWNAQTDAKQADRAIKRHDDLATLEERLELARARFAAWRAARHDKKALDALEDASLHFDRAFTAAEKRYEP